VQLSKPNFVNLGTGVDVAIRELAETIKEVVGYQGRLVFDPTKSDGTPRKLLDVSRMKTLGWQAKLGLREGSSELTPGILKISWSYVISRGISPQRTQRAQRKP